MEFSPPRTKHLLQMSQPAGHRCPKMEKKWPEWKRGSSDSRLPTHYAGPQEKHFPFAEAVHDGGRRYGRVRAPKPKKDESVKGNLRVEDYRFWVGGRWETSRFAGCRACKKIMYSPDKMKHHMEYTHHTVWLTEAYKLLLREKVCVECGKKCSGHKWGIPLCSPGCIEEWMFTMRESKVLEGALAGAKAGVAGEMEHVRKGYEKEWN